MKLTANTLLTDLLYRTETTPLVVKTVGPPQRKRATKATTTHWLLLFFACYSTLGGYYWYVLNCIDCNGSESRH